VADSSSKHPHRERPLGVIEVGACADMMLVEGNPVHDVSLLADYNNTIKPVIKDGEVRQHTP